MNDLSAKAKTRHEKTASGALAHFVSRHGAPFILAGLLWYVLWLGHFPELKTPDDAMRHVSWVGVGALIYLAAQIRSVISFPRKGVAHPVIGFVVSLLPLLISLYAGLDWARGEKTLTVFQVIVLQQASLAVLIDVIFFTYVSMRLAQHSLPIATEAV